MITPKVKRSILYRFKRKVKTILRNFREIIYMKQLELINLVRSTTYEFINQHSSIDSCLDSSSRLHKYFHYNTGGA